MTQKTGGPPLKKKRKIKIPGEKLRDLGYPGGGKRITKNKKR